MKFMNLKKGYTTKSMCFTTGKNVLMDSQLWDFSSIWPAVKIFDLNQANFTPVSLFTESFTQALVLPLWGASQELTPQWAQQCTLREAQEEIQSMITQKGEKTRTRRLTEPGLIQAALWVKIHVCQTVANKQNSQD